MDEFKVPTQIVKSVTATVPKQNKEQVNEKIEEEIEKSDIIISEAKQTIECPYKEPKWSIKPDPQIEYKFEVLKSGLIVEEIKNLQTKAYWTFGRLQECNDIVMAHPTISRFHAVLQYKPKEDNENDDKPQNDESKFAQGWYIYDLGSTHGTFLNKMKIPPKTYIRVRVGHMIKLGGSTRSYILQGPEFDEEPESELTVTELKELRIKQEEERAKAFELQESLREKEGIDWGMSEDADEETDLSVNPYASTNNEELFLDDPKKTLRGFFEREGLELEYKCDEMSTGTFVCRVELPIDDMHGKPIVAEVCHKGKKKECVVQCALEACRILDRHGVLRQSHHEPMKRKKPKSDSDEDDDFLDRTGDVERKRLRKLANIQNNVLTYDELVKQQNELLNKISAVEESILRYQEISKRSKESSESQDEDLDNFMKNLTEDSTVDKTEIRKLRVEEQRLKTELQKIEKLIKIAKPVEIPFLNKQSSSTTDTKKKFALPLFGKRNKSKTTIVRSEPKNKPVEKELKSDEEEIEDEDENEESVRSTSTKTTNESSSQPKTTTSKEKDVEEQSKIENEMERVNTNKKSSSEVTPTKTDNVAKRRIGPSFIPEEILKGIREQQKCSEKQNQKESEENVTEMEDSNDASNQEQEAATSAQKEKKKHRIRNRNKGRGNIDFDDSIELEDKSKYSGWLPPENQTGDGMTSLNEKFGY